MRPGPGLLILVAPLSACTAAGTGPLPLWGGADFFDSPWPSDSRTSDGRPDLSGFPLRDEYPLVDEYLLVAESLDGFGTNSPIYVRFDGAIDTGLLPEPVDSVAASSPIVLLDVDPHSPERGRRIPWTWDWQESETAWQADNLLAVMPLTGFPLRPRTSYALVVTTALARPNAAFAAVWAADHPERDSFQALQETLFQVGLPTDDVAIATVFTTQDPVGELAGMAEAIRSTLEFPVFDPQVVRYGKGNGYQAWQGYVYLPNWQQGVKPYTSEGGGFAWDEDGDPILAGWDRTAFMISVPSGEEQPDAGWPVVIYGHGTGGDQTAFVTGTSLLTEGTVLARAGAIGLSVSMPLHGDRAAGMDPQQAAFNYLNPASIRTSFRQAALDQVYLAELLSRQAWTFTGSDDDGELSATTSPGQLAYFGHSHGGNAGAIAAPFFNGSVRAVVLSGSGGSTALAAIQRKEGGLDIEAILSALFGLDDDEELDAGHPLVGMIQTLAEATDPLNYGPYWSQVEPFWDAQPVDVLMTEGLLDIHTPPDTTEALAAAAGLPVLDPLTHLSAAADLLGLHGVATPTTENLTAWDGSAVSGGLGQYPDQDHFAIFYDSDAAAFYRNFLVTAMAGQAELQEPW